MQYIFTLCFFLLSFPQLYGEEILYELDFNQPNSTNAIQWLKEKDFNFKVDFEDLEMNFKNESLYLSSKKPLAGFAIQEVKIEGATHLRTTIGIVRYPNGDSWEKGILREPLAITISFGKETASSGSIFLPDLPYFLSIFMDKHGVKNKSYKGNYRKDSGRYFCLPCNLQESTEETVELELSDRFFQHFNKKPPYISAIAISVNTTDTEANSLSFIKNIQLIKK